MAKSKTKTSPTQLYECYMAWLKWMKQTSKEKKGGL